MKILTPYNPLSFDTESHFVLSALSAKQDEVQGESLSFDPEDLRIEGNPSSG